MNREYNVQYLPGDVIYVQDAFPNSLDFISLIEKMDGDPIIEDVIPSWSRWEDGGPVQLDPNDPTRWKQIFDGSEDSHRGETKLFNWDLSINHQNNYWPRLQIPNNYSPAHTAAYNLIKLIEDDYINVLDVWYEKTGNKKLEYITRNYCLRKYRTGGSMGPHIDRNVKNPLNTMDWTALIYLNDNYDGGELVFTELDYRIKPTKGSVVFLPCLVEHMVLPVTKGNKYYLFLFMHTDRLLSTSLGEPYQALNEAIDRYKLLV